MYSVDGGGDVALGGDDWLDLDAGERTNVVDGKDVRGVGHGHEELAVLEPDRQRVVTTADVGGHRGDGRAVEWVVTEVDELQPDLLRQGSDQLALGQDTALDQYAPKCSTLALVLLVCLR